MQTTSAVTDLRVQQKYAFVRGMMRMACEDAGDVKVILLAGGFVEPNSDGSIALGEDGWFESCLLPKHTVEALGLVVRLRRWELLHFHGHLAAGIPPAEDVFAHVVQQMLKARPSRKLTTWQALRWQVYRDHAAWLSEPELIVHNDPAAESDRVIDAIADFLIAAAINTRKKRR